MRTRFPALPLPLFAPDGPPDGPPSAGATAGGAPGTAEAPDTVIDAFAAGLIEDLRGAGVSDAELAAATEGESTDNPPGGPTPPEKGGSEGAPGTAGAPQDDAAAGRTPDGQEPDEAGGGSPPVGESYIDEADGLLHFKIQPDEDGHVFSNGISKYKTIEALIASHDTLLKQGRERESQARAAEEARQRQVEEAEARAAAAEAQLRLYEENLRPDDLRGRIIEAMAVGLLPEPMRERMKDMSPEDIEDDPEIQTALINARGRAAERYDVQVREKQAEQKAAEERRKGYAQSITSELRPFATDAFKGGVFDNEEVRGEVSAFLTEKVGGGDLSRLELIALAGMDLAEKTGDVGVGLEVAKLAVDGIRRKFLVKYDDEVRKTVARTPSSAKPDVTAGKPPAGDRKPNFAADAAPVDTFEAGLMATLGLK